MGNSGKQVGTYKFQVETSGNKWELVKLVVNSGKKWEHANFKWELVRISGKLLGTSGK